MVKKKIVYRTEMTHTRTELSDYDIIRLLANDGQVGFKRAETRVFVRIPGGGDWSNADLDITKECRIVVSAKSYDKRSKCRT